MSWDVLNILPTHGSRPSVFEVVLQQRMSDGFKPAFDYFVDSTVAPLFPRLVSLAMHKDELWALLSLVVQRSYLASSRATFGENLYGMWRLPAHVGGKRFLAATSPLTTRQVLLSLVQTVVFPYVHHKLQLTYARALERRSWAPPPTVPAAPVAGALSATGGAAPPMRSVFSASWALLRAGQVRAALAGLWRHLAARLRAVVEEGLLLGWPAFNTAYTLLRFVYLWGYTFGYTQQHDPWMHAAGLSLGRLTPDDARVMQSHREAADSGPAPTTAVGRLLAGMWAAKDYGLSALRYGLLAAILFFKLAEWWFANEETLAPPPSATGPVPPPPCAAPTHAGGIVPLPRRRGICPLCRKQRVNPAASSAGVVYCFKCLHDHVAVHKTCPVTGVPCTPPQIRKLYQM